ncbi:MAG: hypothetical protein GEU91_13605 [Rhizobiales bacterium]|nr:hypothetical protein [Hyphomicrobiales bacterium]
MSLEHSPARGRRAAYSIAAFCDEHSLSRSMFYKMQNQGLGPRLMYAGTKVLITDESAAAWRAEREAASNTEAS